MKRISSPGRRATALKATGIAAALALGLSACGGSAGADTTGGGAGEGFEYGASQDEVNAIVEDLEPITFIFQPPAASSASVMAPPGEIFKEYVEERSNGKITVDVVWGQAIAGYADMNDALADGRIDMSWTLPIYFPNEFPALNDLGTAMAGLPSSPFVGELVAQAIGYDLGWNSQELLDSYEERGLVPLTPLGASGGYYSMCSSPVELLVDWNGTQVRIASTAQSAQVQQLGGTPVSMEYTETFEALQRGTVDCTLGQLVPSAEGGILEVAPHIGYTTDYSFSRSPGAYLAGKKFNELPLAYQQIIFDGNALNAEGGQKAVVDGNAAAIKQAKDAGGSVLPFSDEIQQQVGEYSDELIAEAISNGHIDENIVEIIAESRERWLEVLNDLGYEDTGDTADFDEWYDYDTDYKEFAVAAYENGAAMSHRPS